LLELFGVGHLEKYRQIYKDWINEARKAEDNQRMFAWSQYLAVGSKDYVAKVKSALGVAAKQRAMVVDNGIHALKEPVTSYMVYFGHEKQVLSDNTTTHSR